MCWLPENEEGTVLLWDASSGQKVAVLAGLGAAVTDLAVSRNLRAAAAGAGDGDVLLWSTRTAKIIWRYAPDGTPPAGGDSPRLAFSPSTRRLVVGFRSGKTVIYDPKTGELARLDTGPSPGPVTDVAYAPDGSEIVVAHETPEGRGRIVFRDSGTYRTTGQLDLHAPVAGLAYAGNLSAFGAALTDGALLIWTIPVGGDAESLREHGGAVAAFSLSGDGSAFLSAGPEAIRFWNRTEKTGRTVSAPEGESFRAVEMAPENGLIASTADGKPEIRVWRLEDAETVVEETFGLDASDAEGAALDARIALLGIQLRDIEKQLESYTDKTTRDLEIEGESGRPAYTIPLSTVIAIHRLTHEKTRLSREVKRLKRRKLRKADDQGENRAEGRDGPDP